MARADKTNIFETCPMMKTQGNYESTMVARERESERKRKMREKAAVSLNSVFMDNMVES